MHSTRNGPQNHERTIGFIMGSRILFAHVEKQFSLRETKDSQRREIHSGKSESTNDSLIGVKGFPVKGPDNRP